MTTELDFKLETCLEIPEKKFYRINWITDQSLTRGQCYKPFGSELQIRKQTRQIKRLT